MNKRRFLGGALMASSTLMFSGSQRPAVAGDHPREIIEGQVMFSWRHDGNRLFGKLSAPTPGWIAVGFNELLRLKDTRFVIATVSTYPIRAEEHVALVPDHRNIEVLGLSPALDHVGGSYNDDLSRLEFSLPHRIPGRPALRLAPGSQVHLMIAWSRETDFTHHSAWRRHFDVQL